MPDRATAFTIATTGIRRNAMSAVSVVVSSRNVFDAVQFSLRRFG